MTKQPYVLLSESSVQCGEAGQRLTGLLLEEENKEKYTILFSFVWQRCFFHFVAVATRPELQFSGNIEHATREELTQWF